MHNHIFQPKEGESPIVPGCPACAKIDPIHMTLVYSRNQAILVRLGY